MKSVYRTIAAAALVCCGTFIFAQDPTVIPPDTAAFPIAEEVITPPGSGETLAVVRGEILNRLAKIQSLKADVELSRKDKKGRRIKTGPLELARQAGGRVALTRKDKTEEYIASPVQIWSYDHHDKEAQYIPTGLPVISNFVQSAMALDMLLAMDQKTMSFLGNSGAEGEPCWVIEGKSPDTLKMLGVPVVKMRVWIAKKDGIPRRISMPKEKDTLVLLRHIHVNAPVNTGQFQWTPPRGVKTKNIFGF